MHHLTHGDISWIAVQWCYGSTEHKGSVRVQNTAVESLLDCKSQPHTHHKQLLQKKIQGLQLVDVKVHR